MPCGQPLVKMFDGAIVLRRDPIGNERVQDGAPIVFGASGIEGMHIVGMMWTRKFCVGKVSAINIIV